MTMTMMITAASKGLQGATRKTRMRTGKMGERLSQQSNEDSLRKQTSTMTTTTITMTKRNRERIIRENKVDKDENRRTDGGRTNTTIKLRQNQG